MTLPPLPPIDDYLPTEGPRWTSANFSAAAKRYATDYAEAAVAAERERCALICEEIGDGHPEWTSSVGAVCAREIRRV